MEELQGEGVDFKTLRARFQNDPQLKIQIKPVIPEKPKTLTSPTTKITSPLLASMNSAMENRMAPRVIFKTDKKSSIKRQSSQSEVNDPPVQQVLLDKNQKKEGDLVKQALKDKKLPLVLPVSPVTPVVDNTPQTEPTPTSPVLESPVKESTPKKKTIFNFKKSVKGNKEKADTTESAPSAIPAHAIPASICSPDVSAAQDITEPVAPNAIVPPVHVEPIPVSSISGSVSTLVVSSSPVPESDVNALTLSQPDIVPQASAKPVISPSEIPITLNPSIDLPGLQDYSYSMPEDITNPQEIPDILDLDIPPPIIPEDIPDAAISVLAVTPPVTPDPPVSVNSATPVSSSPKLSPTASPVPPPPTEVTTEPLATLLLATTDPESSGHSSPSPTSEVIPPTTEAEPLVENQSSESQSIVEPTQKTLEDLSSSASKTISAMSALARAEEMLPIRQNHCDRRVLNLLERAKRKCTTSHQLPTPTTPEITMPEETALPVINPTESLQPPEVIPPPTHTAEAIPHVETSPAPEIPVVALPDIPPTDYEDQAGKLTSVASDTQPQEPAGINNLDHRQTPPVPKVMVLQSSAKGKTGPPPPPPRRTPEKPPQVQSLYESTVLSPVQQLHDDGIIIPAPASFASDDSTTDGSEIENPHDAMACKVPPTEDLEPSNSLSVHEQAFMEQLNPDPQTPVENVLDVDAFKSHLEIPPTDGFSDTNETTVNHTVPSPTGTLEMSSSSDVYEDLGANKKMKTLKKQRKGSPLNPYADEPDLTGGVHKKPLFSKKNANPEEKELKKKEKQKEKEKEKDKKEQKEKEKDKKEQKEKEKDKKEQKEKEKDKKEQKVKEKDKKEQKEKEKEKKEQKEKEKEKKEQKEKEKDKKELKEKEKELKEKEKEKKDPKEKEKEKKEQKEKEKKESEMKKRFKITGEEDVIYQAKVTETCKGRKNDLAVKAGETVNIIRTSDCPKGKWLARDSTNKYGYVPVESMELNVQEMLEFGKRAQASRPNSSCFPDGDITSMGSRSSTHYVLNHESFTDDSEEWCDDEDTPFTPTDTTNLDFNRGLTPPETVSPEPDPAQQDQTHTSENIQAREEALRKLKTFFTQSKTPDHTPLKNSTIIEEPEPEEPVSSDKQDIDLQILPPPDLYADIIVADTDCVNSN